MRKLLTLITTGAIAALLPTITSAALLSFSTGASLTDNTLGGTIDTAGWNNLTNTAVTTPSDYGGHSNTAPWNETLSSQTGNLSASLWKSGGYGYLAGSGLHQGVGSGSLLEGGSFELTSTAISGLETVVFQIEVSHLLGYTFWEDQLPVLTFGGETLAADFSALYSNIDTGISFGEQTYRQQWAFQWDLTEVELLEGTEFKIEWTGVANSGIYALQLDQATAFAQVVPEPSTYALMFGLLSLGFCVYRRRSKRS